jgi:hypothetical protein
MRLYGKTLVIAVTVACTLTMATGMATARNLSVSEQSYKFIWTPIEFNSESAGGGTSIVCNATLEGSFHSRTIPKVARTLIGWITRAIVAHPCAGAGEAFALTRAETIAETLPWHLTYEAFSGRLPNITRIRLLLRPSYQITVFGVNCLYTGNAAGEAVLDAAGNVTDLIPDRTVAMPRIVGSFLCPNQIFLNATAAQSIVRGLTVESLNVRLI